jgi:hypothetical protein
VAAVAEGEGPVLAAVGEADVLAGVENLALGAEDEPVDARPAQVPAERDQGERFAVAVPARARAQVGLVGDGFGLDGALVDDDLDRRHRCPVALLAKGLGVTRLNKAWPRRSPAERPSSLVNIPASNIASTSASRVDWSVRPWSPSISTSSTHRSWNVRDKSALMAGSVRSGGTSGSM